MEKNSGSGALPRNKGLSLSQGEYVFFMDSDDVLTKSGLEEMYTLAKKYDADVVYFERYYSSTGVGQEFINNLEYIQHRTNKMQAPPFVDKPTFETENMAERVDEILKLRFWVAPWDKFVRRSLLLEHKILFPHVKIAEDNIWTYGLIFHAKKFLRVPNMIYVRRFSEVSMTGQKRKPQEQINFWLSPVLLGLKYLDELMGKHEFFQTNLSYRYAVLRRLLNSMFGCGFSAAKSLTEDVIYSTLKDEFGERLGEYDVVIPALCAALYREKIAANAAEIVRKFTARIDFQLVPKTGTAGFEIISMSDAKVQANKADWLSAEKMGYFIHSSAGKLDFAVKIATDGRFVLELRGVWVPDPKDRNKRIPYWIDYTKLTVNGKVIFNKVMPAWHDKPFRYALEVKAGEEIKIETEWLPHSGNTAVLDEKFLPYITSRLDMQMLTGGKGDLKIVSVSDNNAAVKKATWLPETETGYFIQSHVGKMAVIAKATTGGQIKLGLRGTDVRDAKDKNKRIPYWIDYTKLTVNGKVIFNKLTPTWHDKPFRYALEVKAGEEIKIETEWLPHSEENTAVQTQAAAVNKKFLPYMTSRLDMQMLTGGKGDLKIVSVSDNDAAVKKATWLPETETGYFIQSHVGKMAVIAKATTGGQIKLGLRGTDVRDPADKNKRIPYWIDYTNLTVNGKVIFNKLTPTWHDKAYHYALDVKANEEIKIETEWLPHSGNTTVQTQAATVVPLQERSTQVIDAEIVNKFKHYFSVRLDFQILTKNKKDFQIVSVSDERAEIRKPEWFNRDGVGYVIQSYAGKLDVVFKVIEGGTIKMNLKGLFYTDPKDKTKHIPYWIDYTKFTVNNGVIFNKLTPVWHDKPYIYTMKAKAGEDIAVSFEWLPHRSDN